MKWIIFIFVLRITIPLALWQGMDDKQKEEALMVVAHGYEQLQPDCQVINIDIDRESPPVTFIATCSEIMI